MLLYKQQQIKIINKRRKKDVRTFKNLQTLSIRKRKTMQKKVRFLQ